MNAPSANSDTIEGSVRLIEQAIGVQHGFLESLKEEDDWSFIIKLHALFEAGISHLLCIALAREELADVFAHLELSDKRAGKMAFAKALSLLDDKDRRFISSLSELRNQLVHNVKNATFDLKNHVASLDPKAFTAFMTKFDTFSTGPTVTVGRKTTPVTDVFKEDPKKAIWWSGMVTLAIVQKKAEVEQLREEAKRYELLRKPPVNR